MLNPRLISDAVVAQLIAIPGLAAAMSTTDDEGNVIVRTSSFHYQVGSDPSLTKAIYEMKAPSMLAVWSNTQGGNFSGYVIWKHKIEVYFRMGNMVAANTDPIGFEDIWSMICNGIPENASTNIRYVNILPGLDIMDTPSCEHMLDPDGNDVFRVIFILPEIGDQPA